MTKVLERHKKHSRMQEVTNIETVHLILGNIELFSQFDLKAHLGLARADGDIVTERCIIFVLENY